ncbi:MAG: ThiF family adenylyltransferase [Pirellulales bacterium]|nr:ThiF family adenylyltransferase [Pirellulales bacterium]
MNTTATGHPHAAAAETAAEMIRRQMDTTILTRGRVVIIGLGGIGLFVARAVLTFLAGLRQALPADQEVTVLLCDGDVFEPGNSYRMDIPDFINKAEAVAGEFLQRNDSLGLNLRCAVEYVNDTNVDQIVKEGDLVLLCCDNHATRGLIGAHCSGGKLRNVVLISGGNDGVDEGQRGSYANVQVYVRAEGADLTAPLDRFHPEIAHPEDHRPDELGCDELVAAGVPQLIFTNLAAASAMCNALARLLMPPAGQRMYDEVALDVIEAVSQPHWISGPQEC